MKISWKIFMLTTLVMVLMFGVFGSGMQYSSFRDAFEYEVAQGYSDIRTFQMTMESMYLSLLENQRTEDAVEDIAEKIQERIPEAELAIHAEQSIDKKGIFYQVQNKNGKQYLCYTTYLQMNEKGYVLESRRNIDKIYEERNRMYMTYLILVGVMTAAGGVLLFSVSKYLTKNIRKLGKTTRKFAGGEYNIRSQIKSRDEIGELAEDFNEMAEKLAENIEELKESVRRQEDFTSAFSHELKTPMTSIIGYADMMRSMKLSEQEIVEFSDYIYHQGKRLEKLSHSMLSLMEVERKRPKFNGVSVPELVKVSVGDLRPLLKEEKVHFRVKAERGHIYGNEELLIMVIRNLMDNARKAVRERERGRITVSGCINGGRYILTVQDNGCGIPKEELGRLTEAFYMVDKSRARKQGGAGLGLALVDKIVKLHEGTIEIQSQEGAGTSVAIALPIMEQDERDDEEKTNTGGTGGHADEE